jgi:hypothetical protein
MTRTTRTPAIRLGGRPDRSALARATAETSSFYAFTATPRDKTLAFWQLGPDEEAQVLPQLQHAPQPIEEGFIWTCSPTTRHYATYFPHQSRP